MLNKRTHVLFDKATFSLLRSLSEEKSISIGKLIRHAVMKTYSQDDLIARKRKRIIEKIFSRSPKKITPYKTSDLVKLGRKFE